MDHLMLISTVVELGAAGLLAWLVLRSARERETTLGLHRATLESLRADLSQLVREAECRAQGLEDTLADRELKLRALLDEIARVERPAPAPAVRRPLRAYDEERADDPAEARLLRDLQLRFASASAQER